MKTNELFILVLLILCFCCFFTNIEEFVPSGSDNSAEGGSTEPDPTDPDPTEPDPTDPDSTEPDPTDPDPTEPDPDESDPTESIDSDPSVLETSPEPSSNDDEQMLADIDSTFDLFEGELEDVYDELSRFNSLYGFLLRHNMQLNNDVSTIISGLDNIMENTCIPSDTEGNIHSCNGRGHTAEDLNLHAGQNPNPRNKCGSLDDVSYYCLNDNRVSMERINSILSRTEGNIQELNNNP